MDPTDSQQPPGEDMRQAVAAAHRLGPIQATLVAATALEQRSIDLDRAGEAREAFLVKHLGHIVEQVGVVAGAERLEYAADKAGPLVEHALLVQRDTLDRVSATIDASTLLLEAASELEAIARRFRPLLVQITNGVAPDRVTLSDLTTAVAELTRWIQSMEPLAVDHRGGQD